jgi:hypothetical protein
LSRSQPDLHASTKEVKDRKCATEDGGERADDNSGDGPRGSLLRGLELSAPQAENWTSMDFC